MQISLLSVFFLPAFAQSTSPASELNPLFGVWGSETQCSRALITPKGTKFASPFEISTDWLGHGDVWCRLTWRSTDSTPNGVTAFAHALCGEDTVRDFQIKFNLEGEQLSLVWNIFHKNGPLQRCDR